MKQFMTRVACAAMILVMAVGMMTGCSTSKDLKTQNGNKVLFTYDNTEVTLKEAWIYAKMTASQYENYYSAYFGSDFWLTPVSTDEEGNQVTFEDNVKEQIISQIKQIIILNNKAEEYKVPITDEEKEECAEYAKAFAKSAEGAAILKECGASEKDMAQIYEKNKIASKVQEAVVADVDKEVSDDEARETTIARIVYATTTTDEKGTTVAMKDKEKAEVLKTAQAALKKIKAGTSLEDVAKEAEYNNTSETFAAGASEEGEAFEKKLAKMKDGDLMDEVMECDNGYVIASLTAYTDREATDKKKEDIISGRQQDAFYKLYEEWTADLESKWSYKDDVDQVLWKEVVLHSEESTATEAETETTPAADGATEAATTGAQEQATEATTEAKK
ncbi:MAG: peptidyl-prolyl cis-trans isomerase [Eubacterium sp.]|nr:peptidyl-prolyl cis-trans isomerase [Eubacterium sp.]